MLYFFDLRIDEVAFEVVDLCAQYVGTLTLADELDALARRVGALVELPGQVLDREDGGAVGFGQLGVGGVGLRLGKDGGDAALEQLGADALDVVAVDEPDVFQGL